MNVEQLIKKMMKEKVNNPNIKLIREIKNRGYDVKTELVGKTPYFWIKDMNDGLGILVSPKSERIEKLKWVEISDIHSGSTYFNKNGLEWFLKEAKDRGYKHVHISGDLTDGHNVYPGQPNWLKYWRQEDQVNDLAEVLQKFNFDYYAIDGNHDLSWNKIGAPKIGLLFKDRVPNFIYVPGKTERIVRGDLVISGIMKRMAHPYTMGGRAAYALSYPSQTYLRNVFQSTRIFEIKGKKYDMKLLQYGHLHFDAEFTVYGVKVTHPLTFQKPNDYTEGMGLGGKQGGRLTDLVVQDGEILEYDSKVLYVPENL